MQLNFFSFFSIAVRVMSYVLSILSFLLSLLYLKWVSSLFRYSVLRELFDSFLIAGFYGDEAPPVPIPNTEVKLICVENT